jgi:hypothetical protein
VLRFFAVTVVPAREAPEGSETKPERLEVVCARRAGSGMRVEVKRESARQKG